MVGGKVPGSVRASGRSKQSWRKARLPGLDEFLEDQQLQQRLGTNFETKPDDELFVVDTAPSKNQTKIKENSGRHLTKLERRRLLQQKEPACFQALVNTSKVSDPSGKRNHTKLATLSRHTIKKKLRSGVTERKLNDVKINRELHRSRVEAFKRSCTEFSRDLWGEDETTIQIKKNEPIKEWLSVDTVLCNNLKVRTKKPQPPKSGFPSISVPHEGTSYNPTYKAHQELLQDVVDTELKIIKDEKHLDKVTSKMFRKVTAAELYKENMEQLRQGLDDKPEENEQDNTEEYKPINAPVKNKKKDLKTKRHIKEHNAEKGKAKDKAVEKKKLADIYKLRFIKDALQKQESLHEAQRQTRSVKKASTIKTPQISARTFEEPPATYQASEDLCGNLRNVKPQGGGLSEHFVSLQRRGIASVSKMRTLRKAPKKRYTLSSHRMPWQQIEMPVKSNKKTKQAIAM
ncbi:ribosome biogenesis protein NOP53 [Arctopsyche grandis]|uniref:ribosome biogenesis protein NOP53 n=1 Tax=Arctopsyche grandis TaxID=121162 RepID=UPI00406D93BD